jgi:hypothetical protein
LVYAQPGSPRHASKHAGTSEGSTRDGVVAGGLSRHRRAAHLLPSERFICPSAHPAVTAPAEKRSAPGRMPSGRLYQAPFASAGAIGARPSSQAPTASSHMQPRMSLPAISAMPARSVPTLLKSSSALHAVAFVSMPLSNFIALCSRSALHSSSRPGPLILPIYKHPRRATSTTGIGGAGGAGGAGGVGGAGGAGGGLLQPVGHGAHGMGAE